MLSDLKMLFLKTVLIYGPIVYLIVWGLNNAH